MGRTAATAEMTNSAAPMSFGSFECAMVVMVPRCTHCHCRIAGHVVRSGTGAIYCSTLCASQSRARLKHPPLQELRVALVFRIAQPDFVQHREGGLGIRRLDRDGVELVVADPQLAELGLTVPQIE